MTPGLPEIWHRKGGDLEGVSRGTGEKAMDLSRLNRKSDTEWWIWAHGPMRVPGVIYGSEALVKDMDEKVYEQVTNVATLPGIVRASYAMPDAHWGYARPTTWCASRHRQCCTRLAGISASSHRYRTKRW